MLMTVTYLITDMAGNISFLMGMKLKMEIILISQIQMDFMKTQHALLKAALLQSHYEIKMTLDQIEELFQMLLISAKIFEYIFISTTINDEVYVL